MTDSTATRPIPELTPELRLQDIVKALPRECFQQNPVKAWTKVAISITMVALGYGLITISPWYLLPFCWFFTGTALTGFFVIAHDAGHRSFAKQVWVNDLVGHILLLPLIYPFHSWRVLHNKHHNYTNKMDVDNAWQPFRPEVYESFGALGQWGYRAMRGAFWWLASIVHWAALHFDLSQFPEKERGKVKQSIAVVVIFAAFFFPTLIAFTGWWGLVKFWLMPWLGYHFWMSTFTLVHHTIPEIQFQEPDGWDAAQAQLFGTVHCDYPFGVEFLCHHINVHIPHHLSTAIPSYNLRLAHQSLQQQWGSALIERKFSWSLMRQITQQCHLYHPQKAYQTFREYHANR